MLARPFGKTGLVVPALGLGGGALGDDRLYEIEVARLVHAALDLGISLIDTARSYGASEERIGRALLGRRSRVVLSTKVGYGIEGVPDWTPESVTRGIDEALARLRTDWIDIVHLHSCTEEVLQRGEVTRALAEAVTAGKVRIAAYSGDNASLDAAALSGAFGSIELSLNPWDQGAIDRVLWKAKERGLGALAKRPLANAFWTHAERPSRPDIAAYWDRGRALALPDFGLPPESLALRFTAFTWGVDCAIPSTTNPKHLAALAKILAEGPLPPDVTRTIREAFWQHGPGWPGVV